MTRVGDVHRFQRGPVTTTQLVMYAGASGDFNRIHFDLPYAQEAGLSAVLAHGMLTMGISVGCALQVAGPHAITEEVSARFLSPVMVGDVIDVTITVRDATEHSAIIEIESMVRGEVVLRGTLFLRQNSTFV